MFVPASIAMLPTGSAWVCVCRSQVLEFEDRYEQAEAAIADAEEEMRELDEALVAIAVGPWGAIVGAEFAINVSDELFKRLLVGVMILVLAAIVTKRRKPPKGDAEGGSPAPASEPAPESTDAAQAPIDEAPEPMPPREADELAEAPAELGEDPVSAGPAAAAARRAGCRYSSRRPTGGIRRCPPHGG